MKLGQTTTLETSCPNLFEKCMSFLLLPYDAGVGPTVYSPCPRRLEHLTICRCYRPGSPQLCLFKRWCGQGLNPRPPSQQSGAQPIELTRWRQLFAIISVTKALHLLHRTTAEETASSLEFTSRTLTVHADRGLMRVNYQLKIVPFQIIGKAHCGGQHCISFSA